MVGQSLRYFYNIPDECSSRFYQNIFTENTAISEVRFYIIYVYVLLLLFSCSVSPILCDPTDGSPPGSSVCRIFQARMTSRHMKRPSLIIRELKSNLTSHTINSYDQKNRKQVLARMWRNWNPYAPLVRILSGIAPVENSMAVLRKIKNKITMWSSNSNTNYIRKEEMFQLTHFSFYLKRLER